MLIDVNKDFWLMSAKKGKAWVLCGSSMVTRGGAYCWLDCWSIVNMNNQLIINSYFLVTGNDMTYEYHGL